MDAPLAPYLPRFSSSSSAPIPLLPSPQLDAFEEETLLTMPEPELEFELGSEEIAAISVADHEAQLNEAVETVRRELEAAHGASLDEAEARHAEALAAAVAAADAVRDAEHGAAIAAQIAAAFAEMREALSSDIALALRPLLEEAIVTRTVAAAAAAVATAVADPDHPSLTVSGPASLLAAIETALGDVLGVEFAATEAEDVTVSANAIRIETRLAEAMTALAEGDA